MSWPPLSNCMKYKWDEGYVQEKTAVVVGSWRGGALPWEGMWWTVLILPLRCEEEEGRTSYPAVVGFTCYLLRQQRAFVNSVGLLETYSKIIKGMVFEAIEWVMGPWLYRLTLWSVWGGSRGAQPWRATMLLLCTEWGTGEAGHGTQRGFDTELGENLAHFMIV